MTVPSNADALGIIAPDGLTSEQRNTLAMITFFTAGFSVMGCVFVIFSFLLLRHRERKALAPAQLHRVRVGGSSWRDGYDETQLVFCLILVNFVMSINEFFSALTTIIADGRPKWMNADHNGCRISGFITQASCLSIICYVACIAVTLYRLVVMKCSSSHLMVGFNAFCIIVPTIIASLGYQFNLYGLTGSWCWVKSSESLAQMLMLYFPIMIVSIVVVVFYIRIFIHVSYNTGVTNTALRQRRKKTYARLFWFPLAYLLTTLGGLTNRSYTFFSNGDSSYVCFILFF